MAVGLCSVEVPVICPVWQGLGFCTAQLTERHTVPTMLLTEI